MKAITKEFHNKDLNIAYAKGKSEERERILEIIDKDKTQFENKSVRGECDSCGGDHWSGCCVKLEYIKKLISKIKGEAK